jgi:hypothetical protein
VKTRISNLINEVQKIKLLLTVRIPAGCSSNCFDLLDSKLGELENRLVPMKNAVTSTKNLDVYHTTLDSGTSAKCKGPTVANKRFLKLQDTGPKKFFANQEADEKTVFHEYSHFQGTIHPLYGTADCWKDADSFHKLYRKNITDWNCYKLLLTCSECCCRGSSVPTNPKTPCN